MRLSRKTPLGNGTKLGPRGTRRSLPGGPPRGKSGHGPKRQRPSQKRKTGRLRPLGGRPGTTGRRHPELNPRARSTRGAKPKEQPPFFPPSTPKIIGSLTPTELPRRRPASGKGSRSPRLLTRNHRPSPLPTCPECPPSRARSSGTWSGTSPEPRFKAWMLGHPTTSRPCPRRLSMTWRPSSPRSTPKASGQLGSQELSWPCYRKKMTTGRWPRGPSASSPWSIGCGQLPGGHPQGVVCQGGARLCVGAGQRERG